MLRIDLKFFFFCFSRLNDTSSDVYSIIAQVNTQLIFSNILPKFIIITNYKALRVCRLIETKIHSIDPESKLESVERTLFISSSISCSFIEAVYFVCSLFFKEIGNTIEGWNDYVTINKLNDEALNSQRIPSLPRHARTSQGRHQFDNSDLHSGLDVSLGVLTFDDLLNTISEWTPLGYGLCGVVELAIIKVIKNLSF